MTDTRTVDQSGRALGPRALNTRRRLLDATITLLNEKSVRNISVVEIARKAGTSPATFYQYFKDVGDATLCLAEEAVAETPEILGLLEGKWRGTKGLEIAREIAEQYVGYWDKYRAVLLVRNLAADEGDRRFAKVRRQAMTPLIESLAHKIEDAQRSEQIADGIHPYAAAAALASLLERLAAYHRELEHFGVKRADIVETCARMLYQTITGRNAPA